VVKRFEKAVPGITRRIRAAARVAKAGYPLGFLLGPIMYYEGWQREYRQLLSDLADVITPAVNDLRFEMVTHRYTERAKGVIQ